MMGSRIGVASGHHFQPKPALPEVSKKTSGYQPWFPNMYIYIYIIHKYIYNIHTHIYIYNIHIQWGATSVKQEMQIFRGTRTSAGWCPLLHAHCWKKVWLSEVPCQHTTSSQHVQACLIGLETTSNTARWVFRAIPCGLCHRIPVLPQWETLLCSKSRFYHISSVPEIWLLENIILSPTDVSQEPCHSAAVSASSCSWRFLVSMFPRSKHLT